MGLCKLKASHFGRGGGVADGEGFSKESLAKNLNLGFVRFNIICTNKTSVLVGDGAFDVPPKKLAKKT